MSWALHPRLAADTHPVASLALSELLLMDDAQYPWLLLVPRVDGATEWIDLGATEQQRLLAEVGVAGRLLRELCAPDKLNVAALGNVVSQLHVHVVARFRQDAAWPAPVWGASARKPYAADARLLFLAGLREALARSQ